jgi:hypothetical protein
MFRFEDGSANQEHLVIETVAEKVSKLSAGILLLQI